MDKKKRLKKIESLKKQVEKHKQKISSYAGRKSYIIEYWEREIQGFEEEIQEENRRLKEE